MSDSKPYPFSPLEDLVEVLDHLRAPVNSEERSLRPGTVPYYGATGLQGWIDKALTNEPLILLAEDGGNFDAFADRPIAYRIDGPAWVNNHAHIIRAKPGVSQSFVFWSIAHKDIRRFIAGGTRTKLTQSEMRRIEVPSPDPTDQVQIAAVLDTLDTTIRQTEAIIEKLKQVKQGLLHDLLTRGIDANGELRPPQSEAPHLYKASPLGWIPVEWEARELASIVASSPNAIVDGPFGSNLKSEHYRSHGVPVIQSGYVTSGTFQADTYFYVTPQHFQSQARSRVDPGDIVMAKIGANAGMCAVLPEDHPFGILAGNCLKITAADEVVRRDWLVRYLHRLYQTTGMSDVRTETAQPAISLGRIRKVLVPVPHLHEQERASANLTAVEQSLITESAALAKLGRLKSGLMDDLLTGRVRVTPLLAQQAA